MGILKLILSYVIVAAHTSPIFGLTSIGPIMAVEVFLIISGFLSAYVLNEKYTKAGDIKRYILSRLRGIYPAYWLVLGLTVVVSLIAWNSMSIVRMHNYSTYPLSIPQFVYLVFVNIFNIGQDSLFFLTFKGSFFSFTTNYLNQPQQAPEYLLVPQAWYLSIQVLFYILAPYLFKKGRLNLIMAVLLLSFLGRYTAYAFGYNRYPWLYRFWFFEIAFFILGYFSYQLYVKIKEKQIPILYHKIIFILTIVVTVFYGLLPLNDYPELKQWLYYIMILVALPFIFILFKDNKVDRYLSKLSYGVFLIHLLFFDIFSKYIKVPQYLGVFIALLSTVSVMGFDSFLLPLLKKLAGNLRKSVQARLNHKA